MCIIIHVFLNESRHIGSIAAIKPRSVQRTGGANLQPGSGWVLIFFSRGLCFSPVKPSIFARHCTCFPGDMIDPKTMVFPGFWTWYPDDMGVSVKWHMFDPTSSWLAWGNQCPAKPQWLARSVFKFSQFHNTMSFLRKQQKKFHNHNRQF